MAYEVIALQNVQKNCCFRKIPVVFKTIYPEMQKPTSYVANYQDGCGFIKKQKPI